MVWNDLADLPLDDWAADVVAEVATVIPAGEPVGAFPPTTEDVADVRARLPHSRWRVTDDRLREVAQLYRVAHERGDHPTQAVADALNFSRAYASRLVMRAREASYLGPTEPGKAGEQKPTKKKESN